MFLFLFLILGFSFATIEQSRHITVGSVRFSFLSPSILRIEDSGKTEDRPSITFPFRYALPVPYYRILSENPLIVKTSAMTLSYDPSGQGSLSCKYLNITYTLAGETVQVCPGEAQGRVPTDLNYPGLVMDEWTDILKGPTNNLNGSIDTSDCYIGAPGCYHVLQSRMQLGLLSREGWSVVDDSNTSLFDGDITWNWRIPRTSQSKDVYIFAHGRRYKEALFEFVKLSGPIPLKPWRAYGVWSSREFSYTDQQAKELIATYDQYQLPLNMLVLDYAWHYGPANSTPVEHCNQPTVAGGQCLGGYGGFVWNKDLFPDPVSFQEWVHSKGLELCLNIHDQCGIDSCQLHYAAAAQLNGIDPKSKSPVPCNLLDKTYALTQSTLMLENNENQNVDYWWNDYGAGGPGVGGYQILCTPNDNSNSSFPNGPPSFGHCMHCYDDNQREKPQLWNAYIRVSRKEMKDERGMVLGVYGGLGHHRYPAVGSGDVFEDWQTLSFEIYLTLTSANVALEWNHDLGGFMPGKDSWNLPDGTWKHNPEIYLRWLQAGVFQPIFRTHMAAGGDPSPWNYPNFEVLQKAFQAHQNGVLPIHPLYYEWPEEEDAYSASALVNANTTIEYMFGDDFVVAPITAFSFAGRIQWKMWVPPGFWVDWWTGELIQGPRWRSRAYTESEIPLLVRASSIIPMKSLSSQKEIIPSSLILSIPWGGSNGVGFVYEDDGKNLQYKNGAYYIHRAEFNIYTSSAVLKVVPCAEGNGFEGIPDVRSYLLHFRGATRGITKVSCPACGDHFTWFWDQDGSVPVLVVSTGVVKYQTELVVTLNI